MYQQIGAGVLRRHDPARRRARPGGAPGARDRRRRDRRRTRSSSSTRRVRRSASAAPSPRRSSSATRTTTPGTSRPTPTSTSSPMSRSTTSSTRTGTAGRTGSRTRTSATAGRRPLVDESVALLERVRRAIMKITAIETLVCHARMRNWIFVKVLTDQPGLYGWGEATLEWHTRARRRRDRGPRRAAHRRRPDAHRAPLADDVPPALLARQRHRPRHRHQRHRHRAVGHPRQGPRRAVPQALGRAGARLRPPLLPPRRREDGGFLRGDPPTPKRFAELAAAAVEEGFTAFKSMAVPETMPLEGLQPIRYAEACVAAMRDAVGDGDRHHGRLPRPPVAAHGACSSPRRSSRTTSTGSRSRAGRRRSTTSPRSSAR